VLPAAARRRVIDAESFAQRLVALLPALGRYAGALTRDPDVAADLVQAVFLRALERRRRFVEPAPAKPAPCPDTGAGGTDLEAWLITMARNLYFTAERTRLSRLRRDGEYWRAAGQAPALPNQLDRLELGDVDRALAALPRRQRQIVLLVALTGLRGKGLARAAGTSHQAAWHRLARGRERLRRLCA
jgi:RNA polymerase sigma-70 factor (ECF subfamily)